MGYVPPRRAGGSGEVKEAFPPPPPAPMNAAESSDRIVRQAESAKIRMASIPGMSFPNTFYHQEGYNNDQQVNENGLPTRTDLNQSVGIINMDKEYCLVAAHIDDGLQR